MNVLVLGPNVPRIRAIIENSSINVLKYTDPIDAGVVEANHIDFIVSFGYRHLIRQPVLQVLPNRVVNLHISYLPWNRGADPNLWSFLEDTPKGITIHHVDEGIDTGDIIAQRELFFDEKEETLATSYEKLCGAILELFGEIWPMLQSNTCPRVKQRSGGSLHKVRDKRAFHHLLANGWNTPVLDIKGKALDSAPYPLRRSVSGL